MGPEPAKCPDVLQEIRRRAKTGKIVFSIHGGDQRRFRGIDYGDVKRVLMKGQREEERDRYEEKHHGWSYAMKGETVDGEWLRVVVVLRDPVLLIVTAYYVEGNEQCG
ncbi:MAG TPA: DUF4258 domain-containing protein [Candidatus Bathyarchaeia archaeon]|nr:DUF4258 domain-containing protein [Candidatus Bathyarchaeia archaeon]